jgi:hypothetical protein
VLSGDANLQQTTKNNREDSDKRPILLEEHIQVNESTEFLYAIELTRGKVLRTLV